MNVKKTSPLLLLLVCYSIVGLGNTFDRNCFQEVNNNISIIPSGQYFKYDEFLPSGRVTDNDGGTLYGITVDLKRSIDTFVLGLSGSFYKGNVQYEFFPIDQPPLIQNPEQKLLNYSLSLSRPLMIKNFGVVIEPIVKLGYRQWNRDTNPENTTASYEEIYFNYFYAGGIGLSSFIKKIYIYIDFLAGRTLQPQNGVYVLQQLGPIVRLGAKSRFESSMWLRYAISKKWMLVSFVNYTKFRYGPSSPVTDPTGEPPSKTQQIKYGFGISYGFG